ncbi:hypothetical protein C4577_04170 [Candidatus Parcubacteria bacterium]|nr:MAG: hypothetical protein C4577_04170 [Candidatus Parcubacteria bacterium]
MNVLFVCHGNICRSPLAEIILSSYVKSVDVCSRGFSEQENRPAAKKVRDWALNLGFDLSYHKSRKISLQDISWSDIILYMDNGNRKRLLEIGSPSNRMQCLADYVGKNRIPDPNFMNKSSKEFDETLYLILNAVKVLSSTIVEKTNE